MYVKMVDETIENIADDITDVIKKHIINNSYDDIVKTILYINTTTLTECIYYSAEYSNEKIFIYIMREYMVSNDDSLYIIDVDNLIFCAEKNQNKKVKEFCTKLSELIPDHEKPYLYKNNDKLKAFHSLAKEYA